MPRARHSLHAHVRPGPKGAGADHAQYIAREGRFKAKKYREIGEHEVGNLPAWARESATRFFAAADEHERANGNSYREFELALQKELSDADRGKLVREFAEQIGQYDRTILVTSFEVLEISAMRLGDSRRDSKYREKYY